jgi:hypothetical protein
MGVVHVRTRTTPAMLRTELFYLRHGCLRPLVAAHAAQISTIDEPIPKNDLLHDN